MWKKLIEWVGGLFGGKGGVQIGRTNKSVSGVSVGGDATNLNVANELHIHHPPQPPPPAVEFEPTPAEIEILMTLDVSQTGCLHRARVDIPGGYDFFVDAQSLGGISAPGASVQLQDAVRRLCGHGLLAASDGDADLYYLTTRGREQAGSLWAQLERGERPDFGEIERLMPELLREMRADFEKCPVVRELVALDHEGICFNSRGPIFRYYIRTHPNLVSLLQVLENNMLLVDVSRTSVPRYRITEPFARYLSGR